MRRIERGLILKSKEKFSHFLHYAVFAYERFYYHSFSDSDNVSTYQYPEIWDEAAIFSKNLLKNVFVRILMKILKIIRNFLMNAILFTTVINR